MTVASLIARADPNEQEELAERVLQDRITASELREILELMSGSSASEAVTEVIERRGSVERRHLIVGAVPDDLRDALSALNQPDRTELLLGILDRRLPSLSGATASLGAQRFTIITLAAPSEIHPDGADGADGVDGVEGIIASELRGALVNLPIGVSQSGAILLGPEVVCDGFISSAQIRVQSHSHNDHMSGFESSKRRLIVTSEATHEILIQQRNQDLEWRRNFVGVPMESEYTIPDSGTTIELYPSNHMLGSVQTIVTYTDGTRVAYSGDFGWPIDRVPEVEFLVVDSTCSPREYSRVDAAIRLPGSTLRAAEGWTSSRPSPHGHT